MSSAVVSLRRAADAPALKKSWAATCCIKLASSAHREATSLARSKAATAASSPGNAASARNMAPAASSISTRTSTTSGHFIWICACAWANTRLVISMAPAPRARPNGSSGLLSLSSQSTPAAPARTRWRRSVVRSIHGNNSSHRALAARTSLQAVARACCCRASSARTRCSHSSFSRVIRARWFSSRWCHP